MLALIEKGIDREKAYCISAEECNEEMKRRVLISRSIIKG